MLSNSATPWLVTIQRSTGHGRSTEPEEQLVRSGLRRLLDSVQDVPAYVVGRRVEVLAWNPLAAALITDFGALPPGERKLARLVYLDESIRELYCDWTGKADDVVCYLRLDAGRHPDDQLLTALVGELSLKSPRIRPRTTPCGYSPG